MANGMECFVNHCVHSLLIILILRVSSTGRELSEAAFQQPSGQEDTFCVPKPSLLPFFHQYFLNVSAGTSLFLISAGRECKQDLTRRAKVQLIPFSPAG